MPEVSGFDLLLDLRKLYTRLELPIIIETSIDGSHDITQALSLGANDYITKPINFNVALARIETQVNMVDFYKDSLLKKEAESISALIVTYQHELNNPLTVALGATKQAIRSNDITKLDRAEKALEQMADVVKKIRRLTAGKVELTTYSGKTKMVKLK